jgi:uncharacterized protein YjiS (DUF1127 family)
MNRILSHRTALFSRLTSLAVEHSGDFHKSRSKLHAYREISRQRKMLAEMTDTQLKDLGISRAEALQEAGKPFWK